MIEGPICQSEIPRRNVAYECSPVCRAGIIVVDVINSLDDKLRDLSIPRGDVTIIVVTGPFSIEDIAMSIASKFLIPEAWLTIEVWEAPFHPGVGIKYVGIPSQP